MTATIQPSRTTRRAVAAGLTDQARSWIMAGIAFTCVLMYLSIWMTYAGTHTYSRYQQLPPGATSTVNGITYKLVKLTRTDIVADGTETKLAPAGVVYVIAELEITTDKRDPPCALALLADGNRTWDSNADFYARRLPQYCGDDQHPVTPGKPWRFEQVFEIPNTFADRLYGVAVLDNSSPAPDQVLTP